MNKFEEKLPSLYKYMRKFTIEPEKCVFYTAKEVQHHCLDKEVVKKVLYDSIDCAELIMELYERLAIEYEESG